MGRSGRLVQRAPTGRIRSISGGFLTLDQSAGPPGDPLDVSVCVVRGADGLLLVDTRSSHREADQIRADLATFGAAPVRWVVNTHAHYDHAFGNARFGPASSIGAEIIGHALVPAHLEDYEVGKLAELIATDTLRREEWSEVVITPPTRLVTDGAVVDLGGRTVVLRHFGRGHTDNDLLVHVADAGVWLAGDLVEESGPPCYGSGSFPLEWPVTTARIAAELADDDVVPGHGAVVDAGFVVAQGEQLAITAALIAELWRAGVPVDAALAAGRGRWPFPEAGLGGAVQDGYAQLAEAPGLGH